MLTLFLVANTITVSNLDGSHVRTFFNASVGQDLRAVAVHPVKGYIYWTDWGTDPKIERSDLDGNNHMTIVNMSHVKWAASITVDNNLQRLYWTDFNKGQICSCDLDGSNIQVIIDHLSSPCIDSV